MSGDAYDSMEIIQLAALAKARQLIDSAETEGTKYRVNIGAATFLLGRDGTREFLIKLLCSHRGTLD